MNSYKAVIVDDEINNILILKHFIERYCLNVEVVGEASTTSGTISVINEIMPDILFLDIRLNGEEVFEVLDQIKIEKAQVIFVTSHDEYALKAIKYNAIDYILKPIVIEELIISINKAVKKIEQQNYFDFTTGSSINKIQKEISKNKEYIAVASMDKIELIKTNDIMYVSSDSKYATFHLINGKEYVSNKNLIFYENILDSAVFFRIHKSFIISIKYTSRIIKKDGSYCELVNGAFLPIAKRKQDQFNRFLKIKE
ncbi:LytR/AlgR family response regulator transcription factor [Flavobacterium sp. 245]|uniref:LytR/AlgR family response regulator transcription factor n=1 Tax=Flavobacterium sp. 245 TaxID=2512115 RepID=UPI00105B5A55|nr:LytTR family DNA-binding domain-containing protein [Flavobacterium sp. 245]TDO94908.1 LytTR family two component transcriptional regulator [Flavobacterium sp. 245]